MRAKGNDKISYPAEVAHPALQVEANGCAYMSDVVNTNGDVVNTNGAL